ncbi:MAG: hypothetical protein FJX76_12060 [Armatimonadetes bacterium]|nr:hypothetical protein [Armatimonadota bacterium]
MYNLGIPNNNRVPTQSGRVFAPGLEDRMYRQNDRVGQGVASGALSAEEQQSLEESTSGYTASLNEFKSNDGRVGPRERVALHSELNGISAQIYGYKHN